MRTWEFTEAAKLAILRHDNLGFDYAWQAGQAILTHIDWSTRWDFGGKEQDIAILAAWKESLIRLN